MRTDGDWEGWTDFFLDSVATIAEEAVASSREIFAIVSAGRARVLALETTSVTAVRSFEMLPGHPIVTVAAAMRLLETNKPTATRAIQAMVSAGVLVETTVQKRGRSFAYRAYVDRLRTCTELTRE